MILRTMRHRSQLCASRSVFRVEIGIRIDPTGLAARWHDNDASHCCGDRLEVGFRKRIHAELQQANLYFFEVDLIGLVLMGYTTNTK